MRFLVPELAFKLWPKKIKLRCQPHQWTGFASTSWEVIADTRSAGGFGASSSSGRGTQWKGWVDRDVWWVCFFNWWVWLWRLDEFKMWEGDFPPSLGPKLLASPSGKFRMVSWTIPNQGSLNLLYSTISRWPATQRKDKCGYAHFNEEGAKTMENADETQSKSLGE